MSLMDAVVKWLSADYPLHEIVMFRSVLALFLTLIIIHFEGGIRMLLTGQPGMHIIRGLMVAVANMTFYLALAVMPIAEATALFFIAPLLITGLSVPFLGETVGWRRWLAIIMGFVGVLVMMGVGTGIIKFVAILPLIAALAYAGTQLMARKIGIMDKASVMSFYITITFIIISAGFGIIAGDGKFADQESASLIFLFRAWIWPDTQGMLLMIAAGVLVTIVGYALSQAYRVTEANIIAPFEYIALPLSVIWGLLIWSEVPDTRSAIGIIMIFISGLYVYIREQRLTKADHASNG